MKRKREVIVVMHKDGRMMFDFQGFVGDECFQTAAEIEAVLRECGIDLEITAQQKKKEEKNGQPANNSWVKQER